MPNLERGPATIHYESWTTDDRKHPWITLVNGHGRTHRDFKSFGRFLNARAFNVLTLDNRGAGETRSPYPFKLDDICLDIFDIWKEEGIEQSHLLGISFGGLISQQIALRFPKYLRSLILVSTSPTVKKVPDQNWSFVKDVDGAAHTMKRYFSAAFAEKHALVVKTLAKEMLKVYLDPTSVEGAKAQRASLGEIDFTPQLSQIKIPTLILHGSEDKIIFPEVGETLHRQIKNSQFHLYDGIGHLFLAEMPQIFYQRVFDFISAAKGSSPSSPA